MNNNKKLLAVLAHPDDESLGIGGILAKYAAEGVETHLITATRGERGWFGDPKDYPGSEALGQTREKELEKATDVLGLQSVHLLDYMDGDLDQADPASVISEIATVIRKLKPQVVVTFDPNGYYGHPDHIAISQFTTAAVVSAAAGENVDPTSNLPPHQVSKLYYMAATLDVQTVYQEAFGDLVMNIDGVERRATPWQIWAITTKVDTSTYWETVWQAVAQHCSQLPGYQGLLDLQEEWHRRLWGNQMFYRAFSLVNGGREVENDLFDGISESVEVYDQFEYFENMMT